eukprot:symbB.v1.2.027662.t1/scaffold2855.1/size68771/3
MPPLPAQNGSLRPPPETREELSASAQEREARRIEEERRQLQLLKEAQEKRRKIDSERKKNLGGVFALSADDFEKEDKEEQSKAKVEKERLPLTAPRTGRRPTDPKVLLDDSTPGTGFEKLGVGKVMSTERVQRPKTKRVNGESFQKGPRSCPAEAGLARKTLLDRLTMALVWDALTLQEIRRECQSRDVCFTGLKSRNESEQRQELGERLFTSVCHSAWETQGIPVKRLGGGQQAAKVVERIAKLTDMNLEELRFEFQALKIPSEAGEPAKKRELLKVMERVAMWQEMPLKELQKDCREMEVSTSSLSGVRLSDAEQRKELIQRCCLGLFLVNWASQGVPVKRIETMQAALQVVKRVQELETMSEAALRSDYATIVALPPEAGKDRSKKEILQRLKEAIN